MAAPIVGVSGQILLNGYYYQLLAATYMYWRPRLRKATPRFDGNEGYVDQGLGKRLWKFTALALNDLTNADGSPFYLNATQIYNTLEGSYALVNQTMQYVDPAGVLYNVRFDHLAWHLLDPTSETWVGGPSFHADVQLVEG